MPPKMKKKMKHFSQTKIQNKAPTSSDFNRYERKKRNGKFHKKHTHK